MRRTFFSSIILLALCLGASVLVADKSNCNSILSFGAIVLGHKPVASGGSCCCTTWNGGSCCGVAGNCSRIPGCNCR